MKYLYLLLLPISVLAETTGNLITNSGFDQNTDGWTLSGNVQRIGDCCPGGHDIEFGDSGSIEQSFSLHINNVTQNMLDNGLSLTSVVEVQNGEGGAGGWAPNRGGADSFRIDLSILDEQENTLATVTQTRTDTTGINGVDFTDTVTYNGTGAYYGNIFIQGEDANAPATLGGPNVDNISVTMEYDPVVLSVAQTQSLNETFEEIGETLNTQVEIIEFQPLEEFTFEVPQEEIIIETFEEIYVEKVTMKEINTGVVNVFNLQPLEMTEVTPLPTIETFEEIPTEVSYGSQENFEEVATEIQIEENFTETRESPNITAESQNFETEETGIESTVTSNPREELVARNESENGTSEERVSSEPRETEVEQSGEQVSTESETTTEQSETETTIVSEEINNETNGETETSESNERSERTEVATSQGEDNESTSETIEESRSDTVATRNNQVISIGDIEKKVNETVKSIDQRLVVTSIIVAKAMQNQSLTENYLTKNSEIFDLQPNIQGGDYFETRNIIDTRNIYSENQIVYNDPVNNYQEKVQKAIDDRIRAEQHLRRIRGY